ncbi:uncharacterized protein LOC133295408 [Gastrolobium bilobum]|uniref:uncharacterized protein LOC133295408 n=1 Tax=Gastrolobium bilobum TaxID=150636 RepID=UPI002AAF87CF|nr:uncharacterized protein LOC133295408 [Gastrolobium bilobum]
MATRPLPLLTEVFFEIRWEESHQQLVQPHHHNNSIMEANSLMARKMFFTNGKSRRNGRPWCDNCNKPDHTKEVCWKLHGKPANWKSKYSTEGRGYSTSVEDSVTTPTSNDTMSFSKTSNLLSKEKIEFIQKLFVSHDDIKTPSASAIVQASKFTALHTFSDKDDTWIVDSGASHHMTRFGFGAEDWQCYKDG